MNAADDDKFDFERAATIIYTARLAAAAEVLRQAYLAEDWLMVYATLCDIEGFYLQIYPSVYEASIRGIAENPDATHRLSTATSDELLASYTAALTKIAGPVIDPSSEEHQSWKAAVSEVQRKGEEGT